VKNVFFSVFTVVFLSIPDEYQIRISNSFYDEVYLLLLGEWFLFIKEVSLLQILFRTRTFAKTTEEPLESFIIEAVAKIKAAMVLQDAP
jgi:hypothetical protein